MGRRVLDLERRVLVDPADGSSETLTASEFDLLKIFAENPNRPLQRDWLLEVIAHREMEAFDRAIDLRITRLRRKIELDPTHPDAIRTVRGVGYLFVPPTHYASLQSTRRTRRASLPVAVLVATGGDPSALAVQKRTAVPPDEMALELQR